MTPDSGSGDQPARSFIEEARREQIIRAAIDTIAEVGYAKASFARIAERAGISAGLISYHFAGKDELIAQVVSTFTAGMEAAITEQIGDPSSYTAALRRLIEAQVHYFAEHPAETRAVGSIYFGVAGSAGERQRASDRERALTQLGDLMREAQDAGEFRDFPPRMMASALLAALEAVPSELARDPDADVGAYADELATTFELATKRSRRRRTR